MQDKSQVHRKILIASANPLFSKGLQTILRHKHGETILEIVTVVTTVETIKKLETWQPYLVIIDYDDQAIDRDQFLSYFVLKDIPLQVMLVSLKASGAVVVYDRKSLSPDEAENWLAHSVSSPNSSDLAHWQGGRKE